MNTALSAPRRSARRRTQGVSLIEALVALAVMAFGLLGVVGMQSTLRFNADVSRQRAEAVRLAQEKMESLRSFGVLSGPNPGPHAYEHIVSGNETLSSASLALSNTDFTRAVTVTPLPPVASDDPRMKTIDVTVSWLDRRGGATESVRLQSNIAQVAPMLGATLGLPGDRAGPQRPMGRHRSIPLGAQPGQLDGTSRFTPPGAPPGVAWTFLNATGQISNVCDVVPATSATPMTPGTLVCTDTTGWLLSGYIRFVDRGSEPTPQRGQTPDGDQSDYPPNGMTVTLTSPASPTLSPICFVDRFPPTSRAFYCFIPVTVASSKSWSGRLLLSDASSGPSFLAELSPTLSDTLSTHYKVCRYTPSKAHVQPEGNVAHPRDYVAVNASLINQNFLVHKAGNGTVASVGIAYGCPDTGPDTLYNSNTFAHQPDI